MAKDIIVFDLETKKEFAEIGGRNHPELLGVSVLGAYSYNENRYCIFEERELGEFENMLKNTGLLIGFNSNAFDIPVLQPYLSLDLKTIPSLDMMDAVVQGVGFRVSLDNLARTTVNAAKSADGLTALQWFREGRIQEVKDYCLKDVEVTRLLYEYGKQNGHVRFIPRNAIEPRQIAVDWMRHLPVAEPEERQFRLI
ncbi:MAG: ribonuclease H-like domain-containing protein [Candidatus Niyogibacteria bacterium]|nr:ribonuclease H-like domain-containing protein [Candidatus Niyogibacteria bacterium]